MAKVGVSSVVLTQLGSSNSLGLSLNSIVYQAYQSGATTLTQSGTVTTSGTTTDVGASEGQTTTTFAASSAGTMGGGGSSLQTTSSSFADFHGQTVSFTRVVRSSTTATSAESGTLYQAGSYSLGSYGFSSISLNRGGLSDVNSLQTTVALETGSSWQTGTKNPTSSAGGGTGSTTLSSSDNSNTSLTSSSGTFNSGSTVVEGRSEVATFTLYQGASFAAGSFSLNSFTYDDRSTTGLAFSQDSVQHSTQTQHIERTTAGSSTGGATGANYSNQGAANFTSTTTGDATYSLDASATLVQTRHSEGSISQGLYAVSSFTFRFESTGTQYSSQEKSESALSTGTRSGTFQLGTGTPVSGTGSFTDSSTGTASASDSRSYDINLFAAGTASNATLSVSSYSLTANSTNVQDFNRTAESSQSVSGANGSGVSFSGSTSESYTESGGQSLTSGLSEIGTFSSSAGFSVSVSYTAGALFSFTAKKESHDTYTGGISGTDSFTAEGTGTGSFAFSAAGRFSNETYTFTSITETGGSSGSFSSKETGSYGSQSFEHVRSFNGSQAFNKAGSYGTGAYSFSTYSASGASSETIADTVGGITNRFERTTTTTTTGTGSTGTMTTVSRGTYTYGSSSPETFATTTTLSVALTGAALPVAVPQERVLPLPPTMGNGGGGPVTSGPAVMGTGDAILQGPWSGGLMLREFLGASNGWVVRIGGQMNGASLGLASDAGGGSQRPLVDWLKMAINGAPPGPMPLGYYIPMGMMSWQPQQTFSLWMASGGSYMSAWAGYTAAHRIADPLGKEAAGRAFSAAIGGLSGSEVSLNWSRKGLEFVAGAADVLTAGLSTRLIRLTSLDQFLDLSSSSFQAGRYAGEAATIALTLWTPTAALQWIKTAHGSLGLLGGLVNGAEQLSNGNVAAGLFSISMGVVSLALSMTSCQWQGLADKALRNLGGASSALKGGAALIGGSAAGTAVTWASGLGASALKGVVSAGGSSAFLSKAAGWVSSGLMVYGAGAGVYETGRRLADGDVLGALLSAGQSMADMHAASRSCFTAEMLLDCDGGRKRADQIQVGDLLWSRPEGNPDAKAELKPVEEVFVRTSPVLTIKVAGQAIRTTAEHPFWVQGEGWLPAGFLRPGDLLRTRGGLLIAVEGVEDNGEVETVYNWRIGEYHTYYVSANEDGVSLWAHNSTCVYKNDTYKVDKNGANYEVKSKATGNTVSTHTGKGAKARAKADAVARDTQATPEEVAAVAAQGYPNGRCQECAAAVKKALQKRGMNGTQLDLDTGERVSPDGNIWSDRAQTIIADTGRHRAIRVGDTVFDNHNPTGLDFPQWRGDHSGPKYPKPGTIPMSESAF